MSLRVNEVFYSSTTGKPYGWRFENVHNPEEDRRIYEEGVRLEEEAKKPGTLGFSISKLLNAGSRKPVKIRNSTPQGTLSRLLDTKGLAVDVTKLDSRRLPEVVKADLFIKKNNFYAPHLKSSGDITFTGSVFRARSLRNVDGDLNLPNTTTIDVSSLERVAGSMKSGVEIHPASGMPARTFLTRKMPLQTLIQ